MAAASRYVRWTGPMPVRSVVRGETPARPRGQPGRRTPVIDSYRLALLGILLACAAVIAVLLWLMFGT